MADSRLSPKCTLKIAMFDIAALFAAERRRSCCIISSEKIFERLIRLDDPTCVSHSSHAQSHDREGGEGVSPSSAADMNSFRERIRKRRRFDLFAVALRLTARALFLSAIYPAEWRDFLENMCTRTTFQRLIAHPSKFITLLSNRHAPANAWLFNILPSNRASFVEAVCVIETWSFPRNRYFSRYATERRKIVRCLLGK